MRAWRFASACALTAMLACNGQAAASTPPLQPYQMVRSLQLIQDRLADGDHAALPMQGKILELIDERMRGASPEDFADARNFRALLIYAMSGGNPTTIQAVLSRLEMDEADREMSAGIVHYLRGQPAAAARALSQFEPRSVPVELGAFLALVKGSVIASDKPAESLALLDDARLLGPGTLVEEAALRRTVTLAAAQRQSERFLLASGQYVRRFLRSPYASQFADAFLSGIVELHDGLDLDAVAGIMAEMTPEQTRVLYLRIARRAAIERLERLVAFAKAGLDKAAPPRPQGQDPRALLYSSLALVASERVGEVRDKLALIDRERLSASDRRLLDAARAIVEEVVAAPQARTAPARPAEPDTRSEDTADPAQEQFLSEARRRIEAVDKLLGEN